MAWRVSLVCVCVPFSPLYHPSPPTIASHTQLSKHTQGLVQRVQDISDNWLKTRQGGNRELQLMTWPFYHVRAWLALSSCCSCCCVAWVVWVVGGGGRGRGVYEKNGRGGSGGGMPACVFVHTPNASRLNPPLVSPMTQHQNRNQSLILSFPPPSPNYPTTTLLKKTQGDEWESRKFYLFEREDLGGQVNRHVYWCFHLCIYMYVYMCVLVGCSLSLLV